MATTARTTDGLIQLSNAQEIGASSTGCQTSERALLDFGLVGIVLMKANLPGLKQITALLHAAAEASIQTLETFTFFAFHVDHIWILGISARK